MSPAYIAKLFLKINIIIAVITLGANTILIYPYLLHLTQLANNLSMDVSSKNYVTEDEVKKYFEHLTQEKASLYSQKTYIPGASNFQGANVQGDSMLTTSSIGSNFSSGGIFVYTPPLKANTLGNETSYAGSLNVAVKSCSGKDLILSAGSSFSPMTDNSAMQTAMDGNSLGGTMVQRGNAFQVEVNTRYVLTGLAMGAVIHMVIPIKVESAGVTTQYYQYDKNLGNVAGGC